MEILSPALYVIVLLGAYGAGILETRRGALRRVPLATLFLTLAVALPTTLQFIFPSLLLAAERDRTRFFDGEWWRLVSALFVQDGGVSGSLFNLLSLVLVGAVAETLLGWKMLIAAFFIGGIGGQLAGFAWEPVGAGNSVGNFGVAAYLALYVLQRNGPKRARVLALLAFTAVVALVVMKDIHGVAALACAVLCPSLDQVLRASRRGTRKRPPDAA